MEGPGNSPSNLLRNQLEEGPEDNLRRSVGRPELEQDPGLDLPGETANRSGENLPSTGALQDGSRSGEGVDAAEGLRRRPGGDRSSDLMTAGSGVPLPLQEVIASVQISFPPLLAAAEQRQIAVGELISSWGEFDTQLKADTLNAPMGFYENYRHSFSVTQPVWENGGYLYGGYKIGRGEFQPWYKERQTNEGGEIALGAGVPLLKDRAIDKRRATVQVADLEVQLADPFVRLQLNQFTRDAATAYWNWVAAGLVLRVQEELLQLAENRVEQIEARVREGDLPNLARIDNQRFVLARQTKLVESEQKFREASIKLSLFLRDAMGNMVVPGLDRLPEFPAVQRPDPETLNGDFVAAIGQRPELEELALQARQLRIQRELACNGMLPTLDAVALASQDLGGAASNPDDKGPFEIEAGLVAALPAQRREARGKVASLEAKLRQLETKRLFVENKVANELQAAMVALVNAARQFELARENLDLTRAALKVGRAMFEAGEIDLVVLNIYEQSVTDAELTVIAAERDFFSAAADYRLGLGLADAEGGLSLSPLPPRPAIPELQLPEADRNGENPENGQ